MSWYNACIYVYQLVTVFSTYLQQVINGFIQLVMNYHGHVVQILSNSKYITTQTATAPTCWYQHHIYLSLLNFCYWISSLHNSWFLKILIDCQLSQKHTVKKIKVLPFIAQLLRSFKTCSLFSFFKNLALKYFQ